LGLVISVNGISMQISKLDAIEKWEPPKRVKELQQFLGFCNYYRNFIPNFSGLTKSLTVLTKKDVSWVWGVEQQEAFHNLKSAFKNGSILSQGC